jgi:hypothetical protein
MYVYLGIDIYVSGSGGIVVGGCGSYAGVNARGRGREAPSVPAYIPIHVPYTYAHMMEFSGLFATNKCAFVCVARVRILLMREGEKPAENSTTPGINVETSIRQFRALIALAGVEEPVSDRCPELLACCCREVEMNKYSQ